MVFSKKVFLQNSQESTCARVSFFRHSCFLVNFAKFLRKPFSKNLSNGWFCINTRFVYCPATTFRLFKNNVTHTYFPAEYFLGLMCKLGTKVSSIFQTLSQEHEVYFQPSRKSAMELFLQK